MTISQRLDEDAKAALRAGEKLRLSTLRRARAELKNAQIDARGQELSDEDAIAVIRRMIKRHEDSIEQFTAGGRAELAEKESAEKAILEGYLPPQADDATVEAVVREVIAAEGVTDMKGLGRVMKPVLARLNGQVDGGRVREVVQRVLAG